MQCSSGRFQNNEAKAERSDDRDENNWNFPLSFLSDLPAIYYAMQLLIHHRSDDEISFQLLNRLPRSVCAAAIQQTRQFANVE